MKLIAGFITLLSLAVALVPCGQADSADLKIMPPADEGLEVQTRGPVHEAYAMPVNTSPQPGPVVSKQPPEPIKELPPDQKPEGDNIEWIPGYWAWDGDRDDYTWVSGFWRAAPPGRKWVPGHWTDAEGGWQWVAGLWAPANQQELPYIDEPPPAPPEEGPSVPAPDDNSFYVPGSWVYRTSGYLWRPGYWAAVQPDFVWTPAQYYWTPAGYCYVDGYWDYPLEDRGLLFAPVYFREPLWRNPDWCYRPSFCVNFGGLLASLFARPAFCHYYFGDYYGAGYYHRGFYPWFAYGRRHHDPLFGYYGWRHRGDHGWYRGLAADYRARVAGDLARPPRTFREQNTLVQRFNSTTVNRNTLNAVQIVRPLSQVSASGGHLARLNTRELDTARQTVSAFRGVSAERQRLERPNHQRTGRPAAALPLADVPKRPTSAGALQSTRSSLHTDAGHRADASSGTRGETARPQHLSPASEGHRAGGSIASRPATSEFSAPRRFEQLAAPRFEHAAPRSNQALHARSNVTPSFSHPAPHSQAARPTAPVHRAAPIHHTSASPHPAHAPTTHHESAPAKHGGGGHSGAHNGVSAHGGSHGGGGNKKH